MHIAYIKQLTPWEEVVTSARSTIGLDPKSGEPSSKWKYRMIMAEHSPIRELEFKWKWVDLMSWVSVHFVRHHVGIKQYVKTQRTDRTGTNRNELPQSALVSHECTANAQAIINVSKERLCNCASSETIEAWQMVVDQIRLVCPELADLCVPKCVYRGFCPEMKCCGYAKTERFQNELDKYRSTISSL